MISADKVAGFFASQFLVITRIRADQQATNVIHCIWKNKKKYAVQDVPDTLNTQKINNLEMHICVNTNSLV